MKIILHGKVGTKFGKEWDLSVRSVNEGLRAIDANSEGFFKYLTKKENENLFFRIYKDKNSILNESELDLECSNINTVHIFPVVKGASEIGAGIGNAKSERKKKAYRMMGYGAGGMALSYGLDLLGDSIGGTLGGLLGFIADIGYEISGALLTQGAMMLLQKDPPEPPGGEDTAVVQKSTASFTFSRPLNNTTQGAVVPVGYGRMRIGSHVISSHVMNSRIAAFNQVRSSTTDDNGNLVGAVNVDHYTI